MKLANGAKDMSNQRYGRLVGIKSAYVKDSHWYWFFDCDCGNTVVLSGARVRKGWTQSCGCLARERSSTRLKKQATTHGFSKSSNPLKRAFYKLWHSMKSRCINTNSNSYPLYGGRGIQICDRWKVFENFRDDMWTGYLYHVKRYGRRNTSIERSNVNGDYEPKNAKWKTNKQQGKTRRNSSRTKNWAEHNKWKRLLHGVLYSILLQNNNYSKYAEYFGCPPIYLRSYIESLFLPGMIWNNHGRYDGHNKVWNIDHITPCYKFDLSLKKDRLECFNYENLRPWWGKDNLERGIVE